MTRRLAPRNTSSSTGPISRSGGDEAGHLGVGRVGHQQVDALATEPRPAAEVGDPAVERQLVHLEVAGVQDGAGRGADRDGERVGDRVVDGDELAVERAELLGLALLRPRACSGLIRCSCSLPSISARVSREPISGMSGFLAQQVRHRADVVLVAVGQDDRLDVVPAVPEVAEVRQDQVDAGLLGVGEQHAAVDDEQPAAVLEDRHVAADLAEAAERDDPQSPSVRQLRRCRELDGWRVAHGAGSRPAAARRQGGTQRGDLLVGGVDQRRPDRAGGQAERAERRLDEDHALGAEDAVNTGSSRRWIAARPPRRRRRGPRPWRRARRRTRDRRR